VYDRGRGDLLCLLVGAGRGEAPGVERVGAEDEGVRLWRRGAAGEAGDLPDDQQLRGGVAANRVYERQEMDPLGAEVGTADPFLIVPDPNYTDVHADAPMFVDGGDPFHLSDGCGDIDGMPASCAEISERTGNGTTVYAVDDGSLHPRQLSTPDVGLGGQPPPDYLWVENAANSSGVIVDGTPRPGQWLSVGSGFYQRRQPTPQNPTGTWVDPSTVGTPPPPPKPIWCQPDVIKAMNKAWSQSGNGGMMLSNGQGGVEAGFNLNGTPSNYTIDQKYTNEINQMTLKYNNLNSPMPTFANFHVHPKGHDGTNGAPSTPQSNAAGNGRGDTGRMDDIYNTPGHQAIQVYVMSRFGLSMYDPRTKQTTQLRKGLDFLDAKKPCP
jgi:hypothetical protein